MIGKDEILAFADECIFQMKPATNSIASLPPIPRESCHPFQSKSATL